MKDFDMLPEGLKGPVHVFGLFCGHSFTQGLAAASFYYFGLQGFVTLVVVSVLIDYLYLDRLEQGKGG